jgi:RNase H-fold protein (predicted Holliday junction resolvase)
MNFLNVEEGVYKEYKETSDFKKILKISKEYKDRYKTELVDHWSIYFDKRFTTEETTLLMRKMITAFEIEENSIEKDIDRYSKDVIILDYLITAKHLL